MLPSHNTTPTQSYNYDYQAKKKGEIVKVTKYEV